MILESCQLMSTAHRVLDGHIQQKLYQATHQNHPCAVWCRKTHANYMWLHELAMALSHEYTDRYGKIHKCEGSGLLDILSDPPSNLPKGPLTEPALAMPEEYQVKGDPVESYRNYYRKGKNNIATWKHGNIPIWF